jgi:hypothetical protein
VTSTGSSCSAVAGLSGGAFCLPRRLSRR